MARPSLGAYVEVTGGHRGQTATTGGTPCPDAATAHAGGVRRSENAQLAAWLHAVPNDTAHALCGASTDNLLPAVWMWPVSWRMVGTNSTPRCPACLKRAPLRPIRMPAVPQRMLPALDAASWWTWSCDPGLFWIWVFVLLVLVFSFQIVWPGLAGNAGARNGRVIVGLMFGTVPLLLVTRRLARWGRAIGPRGVVIYGLWSTTRLVPADVCSFGVRPAKLGQQAGCSVEVTSKKRGDPDRHYLLVTAPTEGSAQASVALLNAMFSVEQGTAAARIAAEDGAVGFRVQVDRYRPYLDS